MADFEALVPAIREDFDPSKMSSSPGGDGETRHSGEKAEFMEYCFREALTATEAWIAACRSAAT